MPSTLGIVASGEDVFNDAVLWLDTARSVANETTMVNYGKGGSALNATYGSSAGADTNDPLLLTHTGTNYLYLPGPNSNYASTPSATALNITGDIEIVMRISADDWTPTAQFVLISKRSSTNLSWQLSLTNTGQVVWSFNNGADLFSNAVFTAPVALTDGTAYWLKFTRIASTGAVNFLQAPDQATEPTTWPTTWTQSGTRSAGNITAQAVELAIGASRLGVVSDCMIGKFYRAIVRNGIDGTTVFDADFTTGITSGGQTTFTESSANAATVTINRATSGRKAVAVVRNVLLFGTDDYLQVADNDLVDFTASDSWTLVATVRQWGSIAQVSHIVSKQVAAGTGARWRLSTPTSSLAPNGVIGDGTNAASATAAAPSSGALSTFTMVVNRTTNQMTVYTDNTPGSAVSTSAVGSSANALNLRIGAPPDTVATNTYNGEVLSVAIWRRVLSTNEIATAVARYA